MSPRGAPKKVYPDEVVERVRHLYVDQGMSQVEVAETLGTTQKVIHKLMRNHQIPRRPPVKREQRGSANSTWGGDLVTYQAFHKRVEAARGRPLRCYRCGKTEGRFHWANLTGKYEDVEDYERMCATCHHAHDKALRAKTGKPLSAHVPRRARR